MIEAQLWFLLAMAAAAWLIWCERPFHREKPNSTQQPDDQQPDTLLEGQDE